MLTHMISINHYKIFRQSILKLELILLVVFIIGLNLLILISGQVMTNMPNISADQIAELLSTITWPGGLVNTLDLSGAGGLGGILLIILTGAVTTQEYHWRTVNLWLGRGVPRATYALARFASFLLPALVFVLAAVLAGGLSTLGITLALNGSVPFAQVNFAQLALSVLRVTYAMLPYAALTFFIGTATRSTVAAVGGGLVISLLVENLLAQLLMLFGLTSVLSLLPMSLTGALNQLNATLITGSAPTAALPFLDPLPAALGIALYTALFLALACWKLHRQDLAA